jgi:CRP-like cAMP-binding protein
MLSSKILTSLSDAEFARLLPLLEPTSLTTGEQIGAADEPAPFCYFPESAIISCHADMQDGKTAEVAMIGKDGATGIQSLLGLRPSIHSLNVNIGGSALRVRRDELTQMFKYSEELRRALLTYVSEYLTQVAQRSACAILHHMEQRLAVWLLMLLDRLESDTIEMTHERIAHHMGVRRAGITEIAGELQHRGIISYTRGHLRVVDRPGLEQIACECYGALSVARPTNTYM